MNAVQQNSAISILTEGLLRAVNSSATCEVALRRIYRIIREDREMEIPARLTAIIEEIEWALPDIAEKE